MRNKTKIAFLSLILSAALIAVACGKSQSSQEPSSQSSLDTSSISSSESFSESTSSSQQSSSQQSSSQEASSSEEVTSSSEESSSSASDVYFTVTFKVDGAVVQTSEVKEGELVTYSGEEPTKAPDANASKYRFTGWDRDLSEPITENTVINAVFAAYGSEIVIDDFESYEISAEMIDEGWTALTYSSSGWTDDTKAAVSLSSNATEGEKALKFDAWANQTDYKFAKIFKPNEFTQSANALQFDLKLPTYINKVKVLLHATVTIAGTVQAAYFSYPLMPIPSGEYISYTIPLDADGWALWGEEGKSIKVMAEAMGINQDDLLKYLTRIEFYVNGNDTSIGGNGWGYIAFLDSLKFVTLTNPVYSANESIELYDTYTGTLANDHIVRIDINADKSATAKVIDLEVPQEIPGNITVDDKVITFTSADSGATLKYVGRLTDGGKTIKFISSDGSLKNAVDEMKLGAVQVVDNFEQYETDGVAYYQGQPNPEQRSGCRGAYYSEYYAGDGYSSEWGGNGWSILGGNGDQLKLKNDSGAHNGSKYLCLKNSQWNAIRYMQWGLYDGTSEKNSFRGSKFSFWARTSGTVPAVKVALYWQTAPRNATKDSRVASQTFAHATSVGEWTHYEIDINPGLEYYGYLIFMEKNGSSDSYLYIDDVEVYNANPYAHYEAPEQPKEPELVVGMVYMGQMDTYCNTYLTVKNSNTLNFNAPKYYFSQDCTYVCENGEVTITLGDTVYVATISQNERDLTFKSVTGPAGMTDKLQGVNFSMVDYADNAETYLNDGIMYYQSNQNEANISGARGAYFCEYAYSGTSTPVSGSGWILMGGSGDQLQLDKSNGYDGNQSLKMKKSSAGEMRYYQWNLYKGDGEGRTGVTNFSIALKNPNSSATPLSVRVYKTQKVTPTTHEECEIKEITLEANQDWTVYTIDLDPNETYYGYAIFLPKASGAAYINVDAAIFYNAATDPSLWFTVKKDVAMLCGYTGSSIKFGDPGQAFYTDATIGLNNVACTYIMYQDGETQRMEITINGVTFKGTYSLLINGKISFYVTEIVNGPLGDVLVGDNFEG